MRYWLHHECGHAQAYSNSYHNGEKRNPHLTASLLELRTPGGTVIVALEPAGLSPYRCEGPAPQAGGISLSGCSWARSRTQLYFECYYACRRHQRCHCRKRRPWYVADFWAALGQATACLYLANWGAALKSAIAGRRIKRVSLGLHRQERAATLAPHRPREGECKRAYYI